MDILTLIKTRRTIRRYKNKPIPKKIINKIIEAGIWGPSVPSFLRIQPWQFVVVVNKTIKKKLAEIVLRKSKQSGAGVNVLLSSGANIIASSAVAIVVYNSGEMKEIKNKYKLVYSSFAGIIENAQLSAISAAIQNMILEAENLKIGSCWLDTPLFCVREINALLKTNKELVAVLTLGYPAEEGRRAPRKPESQAVVIK